MNQSKITAAARTRTVVNPESFSRVILFSADRDDAELLAETLSHKGFAVELVSTPQECLAVVHESHNQEIPIASVFLSLDVPSGLDGLSTARLLRQNAYWGSIVVFSNHYLGRYEWESEEAGCDAFILREQLEERIEEILAVTQGGQKVVELPKKAETGLRRRNFKLAASY